MEKLRIINRNMLKIIAVICMIIDHISKIFRIDNIFLIALGRISFILFAFLVAEGIYYTHNKKKYFINLLILALLTEVPFDYIFEMNFISFNHQNVIWTFLMAFSVIIFMEKLIKIDKKGCYLYYPLILFSTFFIGTFFKLDYMGMGVLLVIFFYYLKKGGRNNIVTISILIILFCSVFYFVDNKDNQLYGILSIIPLCFYNNKRGANNKFIKYMFYSFYPLHLILLYIIDIYF